MRREILLADHRGIYIPRDFCRCYDLAEWNLSPKSIDCPTLAQIEASLSSPDNDDYWDCWDYVLENAYYEFQKGKKKGEIWRLEQDGDLFAVDSTGEDEA